MRKKILLLVVVSIVILPFLPIAPWHLDSPSLLQLSFQDPATTVMEGIYLFNIHILFLIIGIVLLVAWILFLILLNFLELTNSSVKNFTHSSLVEIVWTSVPAVLLLNLSAPSFSLLYSLDEIASPELTLKVLGHQWYWSYEVSDFMDCLPDTSSSNNLKYSSYMFTSEFLKNSSLGLFKNLETDRKIVLPTNTHLRLTIAAIDVLHSWTVPSFGTKVDACPGRLNQANVFVKRFGFFLGQCSEICGANHGFMPTSVLTFPSFQYQNLVMTNLDFGFTFQNTVMEGSTDPEGPKNTSEAESSEEKSALRIVAESIGVGIIVGLVVTTIALAIKTYFEN